EDLQRVGTLATELARGSWFAACGEPLLSAERAETARYLAGLGLGAPGIAGVESWNEAAVIAQRRDWNHAWWDAEERAALDLKRAGIAAFGEAPLFAALSAVAEASAALHGHAALAAARAGVADPALSRVAAGAAAMACHQMGLVLACGLGEDHPLAIKYRLFAGGRWLLGLIGGRCYLF
ncbi:MAG TPA: hypothetical protein VEC75_02730, partial [Stellaceae bacterium]|nr:hypothetical protein [Stellaceae bacterium]